MENFMNIISIIALVVIWGAVFTKRDSKLQLILISIHAVLSFLLTIWFGLGELMLVSSIWLFNTLGGTALLFFKISRLNN